MSDIKTLEIPKWGLSMEEGTIAQWLIQEGDHFSKGQDICEIETTKIVNVLEAPFEGTLRKIIAHEGDTLVVGGFIAVCAEADVSDNDIQAFIQSLNGVTSSTSSTEEQVQHQSTTEQTEQQNSSHQNSSQQNLAEEQISTASSTPTSTPNVPKSEQGAQTYVIPEALRGFNVSADIFATPHALKLAEQHQVNLSKVTGSGREGRISVADLKQAVIAAGGQWPDQPNACEQASTQQHKSTQDDSQVPATPVARRLAKQWGINLNDCRQSGSRGRICKEDIEAVYFRQQAGNQATQSHQSEQTVQTAPHKTVVEMNGMRRAIASRLQAAKRNAPHFRLVVDLNVEAIQALRQQINNTVPEVKLSINDMLIKSAAAALVKVPQVNVQFDEDKQQIIQFDQADISVAVAIDNGLITPIVKSANQKSLSDISNEMRDLATRAKTGKLKPDEFQGGSFSISNLGMLGIKHFDAIINPPQGAILALGASEKRTVVEKDTVVIREIVTATLSCDHRVIDGALGAKFLSVFKQYVENPALILV
ncbi:2-oxo acid dehydrogenase subunit E2 [Acinetobacter sp. 194]|nr:2-oxo acid dehydrogenase subunit E2 [Acinetobacter shaoyimingii]NHB58412.1 2-oxo acid dehydrogenase subunit E2 [Acinetobacter shaoyimingii]